MDYIITSELGEKMKFKAWQDLLLEKERRRQHWIHQSANYNLAPLNNKL